MSAGLRGKDTSEAIAMWQNNYINKFKEYRLCLNSFLHGTTD